MSDFFQGSNSGIKFMIRRSVCLKNQCCFGQNIYVFGYFCSLEQKAVWGQRCNVCLGKVGYVCQYVCKDRVGHVVILRLSNIYQLCNNENYISNRARERESVFVVSILLICKVYLSSL
eukprot:TRINITY_DN40300_c0_g1_i1.p2 TRINITY_DN40300_c0_g1~~TRINITY_DN40300_c0_g1_i1.p2  ORF type:complete len:118 (-),score=0.62 TRINITY_DN40300_c0_g1_i1:12-365(-)